MVVRDVVGHVRVRSKRACVDSRHCQRRRKTDYIGESSPVLRNHKAVLFNVEAV